MTYNDKEYDGTPIVPEGTLTVTDDKVPVSTLEITYNGINGTVYENTTVAPTEVGNYKVTYKVPDSNIDYKGSVSYEYSITQATPDYTLPSDLSGILNNKLSTVTLPNGFEWTDENIVMSSSGTQKYAGKFVPSDQKNYKIVNVEISVYVKGIFSVTTSVEGGNGTITASKNDIVEGSNFEIEFTPDEYYIIDTVTLNGEDVTANVLDYKLTILDIKENKTVVVKYREKDKIDPPYTVVTVKMVCTYRVRKSIVQDENRKVHTVYGIEAVGANGEIIQGYPDVFSDRQKAEHFAGLYNECGLSLFHFSEVVEDALTEKRLYAPARRVYIRTKTG